MATVFFSYSHRDEALRDELEVHLAMLKRQCVVEAWHDRRIIAGTDFAGAISEHLERADIILLLVSPHFLGSDYCYDVEMKRAMERHEGGEARVIPVILQPCDWHSAPFGKLLAVPTDGKPIAKYPNQNDAFLEVVRAIRKAADELGKATVAPQQTANRPAVSARAPDSRSSNLRVKKSFTDHDRDAFLDQAFEYIANFFEGSLKELQERNPGITARFRRIDANRFTAALYRDGNALGECSVRLRGALGRSIVYGTDISRDNSFNEALSVVDDGQMLFLKPMHTATLGAGQTENLSEQGAAEHLWAMLLRPLQR